MAEAASAIVAGDRSLSVADAVRSYGRAAALATATASASGEPGAWTAARDLHDQAAARLLKAVGAGVGSGRADWRERLAASGISVVATDPACSRIDRLRPADDWALDGVSARYRRDGWGLPLVATLDLPGDADDRAGADRFLPNELAIAATAVLRTDSSGTGVLELADPRNRSTVAIDGGGTWPLAADFTTPLMVCLQQPGLQAFEPLGLARPEALWRRTGVVMPAPYQPGKVPVLLVHGLWSDPRTWLAMLNDLEADPTIRERYQFWTAFYATGYAPIVSAWRIRQSLTGLRDAIDPAHHDPALDRMVVVAHSMGGIVAKLLVQDSGDVVRRSLLRVPLDQLDLSDESRRFFTEALYFQPIPSIRRLILIGAPHRGSALANEFDARYGAVLLRRRGHGPDEVRDLIRRNRADVLQPGLGRSPLSGVGSLALDQPTLLAINQLPIAAGVEVHSIIGVDASQSGRPLESTDDQIVAYPSAHLEGVPETLVTGEHRGLPANSQVIAEVRRLLETRAAAYNERP